jgi:hypothetical protein
VSVLLGQAGSADDPARSGTAPITVVRVEILNGMNSPVWRLA